MRVAFVKQQKNVQLMLVFVTKLIDHKMIATVQIEIVNNSWISMVALKRAVVIVE